MDLKWLGACLVIGGMGVVMLGMALGGFHFVLIGVGLIVVGGVVKNRGNRGS